MNIKVISEEIIKPSSPTPNHLRYLPFSLLDHANKPTLTPLLFFYSQKNDNNHALARLEDSLPNTLSLFYPLAGRIHDANTFTCNDDGVPYVHAFVNKPLEDVAHKMDVCDLDRLLPSYGEKGCFTTLLLAIQVNCFSCGGLAIGVKMNHVISDAFSLLMFVKTWASMANTGKEDHLTVADPPLFETWKIFPPPPSPQVKEKAIHAQADIPVITKWFMFSEAKLNSLQSKLISFLDTYRKNNNNSMCDYELNSKSLGMVLSAFLYSRINVACHNDYNNQNNVVIPREVLHPVNIRHLVSPIQENSYYFGNMIVHAIAKPCLVVSKNEDKNYNSLKNEACLLWYDFMKSAEISFDNIISKDSSFVSDMKEGKEDLSLMKEHYDRKSKGR
ncbi:Acetyl-CoA-benzylalcohol acetyltransferase [Bienertia sinuspersici]